MTLETEWLEPGRVLLLRIAGDVNIADLQATIAATREARQHVIPNHRFHTVTDLTAIGKIPLTITELKNALHELGEIRSSGWAVVISNANPVVHFMVTTLAQLFNFRVRIFTDLEEGLAFLYQIDETLPERT